MKTMITSWPARLRTAEMMRDPSPESSSLKLKIASFISFLSLVSQALFPRFDLLHEIEHGCKFERFCVVDHTAQCVDRSFLKLRARFVERLGNQGTRGRIANQGERTQQQDAPLRVLGLALHLALDHLVRFLAFEQ